jgi:hypothetical protein
MIKINAPEEQIFENLNPQQAALLATLKGACKKIAPVWPLENFVAVNPYLGLTDKKFEQVAQELAAAGGIQMTLPTSFYLQKLQEGAMQVQDIATVLSKRKNKVDAQDFIRTLERNLHKEEKSTVLPTVADIATEVTHKDWNRFVIARISAWAASYFDHGQALWAAANQKERLFTAWKSEALVDRTPELSGLKGFRALVKGLPDNPIDATRLALEKLGVPEEATPFYFHQLLLRVGGWAAYAARLDWDHELYGGKGGKLIEFLAVLSCWEACLLESLNHAALNEKWQTAREVLSIKAVQKFQHQALSEKLVLQESFDLAAQRSLIHKFQSKEAAKETKIKRAKAQAIFCIDVRSEVFRRNLELVDDQIETLGFAGFFAFSINYVPMGHTHGEAQCPVLLKTGPTIMETLPDEREQEQALKDRIFYRQAQQVWKSFKSGAVSCFSFVSPIGLSYLPKLFTDSFGLTRPVPHPEKAGMSLAVQKKKGISLTAESNLNGVVGIPVEQQIQMAKNALKAMSLAEGFAKFVLIVGHGSTMVNNPHATGYDCGACGGHTGEANARVAAAVLNDKAVRAGLKKEHLLIAEDTVFLACLHDTTTDEVSIYNHFDVPAESTEELKELEKSLAQAGYTTRMERSVRLSTDPASSIDRTMMARSKDWSQVRPEWGLAGCSAFVVAPRARTRGIDLEGKSFLHSYDWKKDEGFSVLELIMTAPMVVTSWINLQYYGSTVDNKNYGSGNKTLHNVTAGLGVLEGYSGDLRVGLPMQSIHDGEQFQHEPLKLNVVIEAPIEAMNGILEKHQTVRDLCDNGWLHLLAMDETGRVSHRYLGNLHWETTEQLAA